MPVRSERRDFACGMAPRPSGSGTARCLSPRPTGPGDPVEACLRALRIRAETETHTWTSHLVGEAVDMRTGESSDIPQTGGCVEVARLPRGQRAQLRLVGRFGEGEAWGWAMPRLLGPPLNGMAVRFAFYWTAWAPGFSSLLQPDVIVQTPTGREDPWPASSSASKHRKQPRMTAN